MKEEGFVHLRLYAELNDFLPPERRGKTFTYPFDEGTTIEALLHALGVPLAEVDLILVNGESVDPAYPLQHGDRVSIYPVFESWDITPLVRVRERPLRVLRFVLDADLGRLAALLRRLGFDVWHQDRYESEEELARISRDEKRILLTRDRPLLERTGVTRAYWVRESDPHRQLAEILQRFDLVK